MKKIKKLLINCFLSHKKSVIDFSNGITCFTGESDQGKSAISKALDFVLNNNLEIVNYITIGEKGPSQCTIVFEDNSVVRRTKSSSINRYELGIYTDKNEIIILETFDKIGKTIPNKVLETINSRPIQLTDKYFLNLNFAYQLDIPFLFDPKQDKGSIKAKLINHIANIQEYDIALQNVNKKISNLNCDSKQYDNLISKKISKLKQYNNVNKKEEVLNKMKILLDKINELQKSKEEIFNLKDKLQCIEEEIYRNQDIISFKDKIIQQEEILEKIEVKLEKTNIFEVYKEKINRNKYNSEICNKFINKTKQLKELDKIICKIEQNSTKYNDLINILHKKQRIEKETIYINKILKKKNIIGKLENTLNIIENETKVIEEIKNIKIKLENKYILLNKIKCTLNYKNKVEELEQILQKLEDKKEKIELINNLKGKNVILCERIEKGNKFIQSYNNKLEKEKEDYSNLLLQFGKCPLCGNKLNKNHLQTILNEL